MFYKHAFLVSFQLIVFCRGPLFLLLSTILSISFLNPTLMFFDCPSWPASYMISLESLHISCVVQNNVLLTILYFLLIFVLNAR